jgi:hypothetical protein
MKKTSYYKKLKAQKDNLISQGWSEVKVTEDGKQKRKWVHPEIEGIYSVNGAYKLASSSAVLLIDEVSQIKETLNKVIDAVCQNTASIQALQSKVREIISNE